MELGRGTILTIYRDSDFAKAFENIPSYNFFPYLRIA